MTLTKEQKEICDKRLVEHQHNDYFVDIKLSDSFILKDFFVKKGVFRPENTSGYYFARYLVSHPELYSGKSILDLGCGTGIQGIVCGLNGASKVILSDVSDLAKLNVEQNLKTFSLLNKSSVVCGDLFEKVKGKYDVILFNHPFFDNKFDENNPITRAWFDDGKLLTRFYADVALYLNEGGQIIMPFFPFAGHTNDPLIQGERNSFTVNVIHQENVDDNNLQKGKFLIYLLSK